MPELHFKGKEFVYNHHLSVPYRPLVPQADRSVGATHDLNGNLIIHGDNLLALKALMPLYAGKVDCVFIDPPYNTGNKDWSYNDNVDSPMLKEWLKSNPISIEDGLRHDKWLAMMWPRLNLLKELLSDTGIIAVCIGLDEHHRLRSILDEIFGEDNFITELSWQSRAKPGNSGDTKSKPQSDAEFVILYSKTPDSAEFELTYKDEERKYPHLDESGKSYRTSTILTSNRGQYERQTMRFSVGDFTPSPEQRWKGGEKFISDLYKNDRIEFKDGTPSRKYYPEDDDKEHRPFYCFVPRELSQTAEDGKSLLNDILGTSHGFDTVKPLGIVNYVLSRLPNKNALILDSFAGSGTTAQVVANLNVKDEGNRKYILVEGETYVNTLTAERVRRVINGYEFQGNQREELHREKLNFSSLKNSKNLLEHIASIENLESHRFNTIKKEVKDGELIITGENAITEKVEGLGGSFTYCTLGDPIDLDGILTGKSLPSYEAIGSWLYHTATGEALNTANTEKANWYLGETSAYHVWLVYKPELEFLKSRDAALTLNLAETIAKTKTGKKNLVFAPAKFVPNKTLLPLGVEYAPLPFSLYKLEK